MQLWIAEKPSLARGIAAHLGQKTGGDETHIQINGGQAVMTWCVGHILELKEPDFYLPASVPETKAGKKVWRMEDLPIIPKKWELGLKAGMSGQFKAIKSLAKKASEIVVAGDPDREGQLLVDEVLIEIGIDPDAPNIKRIWLPALDDESVQKAIRNLKPNREFRNYRLSAQARSYADWLIGMNGSRAFSVTSDVPISVGRVQTPTAALVYGRDQLIANFKPKDYFVPYVVMPDGTRLTWHDRKGDHPGIDEQGRIIDKALADEIMASIKARCPWIVSRADEEETNQAPPLPHSLDSLAQHLSKAHQMTAQDTLKACQALYEKHKLTTYPRTDSRHLPESMYEERSKILRSLHARFRAAVDGADPSLKSKVWNDKKVTAHHAIIPTGKAPDGQLNADESKAYETITKYYLAQFYPAARYRETSLEILFGDQDTFVASTKSLLSPGWRALFGADEVEADQDLPAPDMKPDAAPGVGRK